MLTGMAYSTDRMRLKDKIIANIAKAIKGIQEAVFYRNRVQPEDTTVVLKNNDRECHKLCENLDHVFLHGLRHVTNGYWKVVTEFTRKDAVKDIQNFSNITTDLGRGRAWIFMALNECLLESYIRNISENVRLLKKYYVKEALLLDQQQMSVLLTLTSGLECVVFKLECDLPYLDLSAYPPRTRTASELEEDAADRVSHHSVSSFSSRHNSETAASTPESVQVLTDSDTSSISSIDAGSLRQSFNRVSSVSADSGFPGDILSLQSSKQRSITPTDTISISSHGSAGEPDRLTRLENLISLTKQVEEVDRGGLEVIRVKGGKKSSGARKKVDKKNSKQVVVKSLESSFSNSSGLQQNLCEMENSGADDAFLTEKGLTCEKLTVALGTSESETERRLNSSSLQAVVNGFMDNTGGELDGLGEVAVNSVVRKNDNVAQRAEHPSNTILNSVVPFPTGLSAEGRTEWYKECSASGVKPIAQDQIFLSNNNLPSQHLPLNKMLAPPSEKMFTSESVQVSETICDTNCNPSVLQQEGSIQTVSAKNADHQQASALQKLESKCADLCRPVGEGSDGDSSVVKSVYDGLSPVLITADDRLDAECNHNKELDTTFVQTEPIAKHKEELEADFYGKSGTVFVHFESMRTHSFSQLQDYVDYVSGSYVDALVCEEKFSPKSISLPTYEDKNGITPRKEYSLKLDNNTKLQIMLDVFRQDDEEISKMFVTREGHTEGDIRTVYVLVTNYMFYLLNKKDRKFIVDFAIHLRDLNFVTLSLNKQMLHIESIGSNKKKERIWLTPGDHILAQEIVDCLEAAVKGAQSLKLRPSTFSAVTDDPTQVIALKKYITHDCHCQDDCIEDYSLVFWEDAQASKIRSTSVSREGTLLLRVHDPFKGHRWKTVFAVLRDFMLCIFDNKTDTKPQQYVRLGGEQCVGCRLETLPDRPHCIEIILAKGGSWYLSAGSEGEASAWRQALCLAVSEGLQDNSVLSSLPCVSLVTQQKLLLCHEDVQTRFFRTIASAKVEEVTALTLDPDYKTYCIVEFESQEQGVSSERWVLYFNAALELDRFTTALGNVWRKSYHVPLSPGAIDNLLLQRHCQEQVELLQNNLDQRR